MKLPLIPILLLASFAGAQCTASNPGTTCQGPLTLTSPPGNTMQANIVLVDVGMPPATPAVKQYILSIQNGTLVESDNGGAYHSLVGPKGDKGDSIQGPAGQNGKDGNTGAMGPTGPPGVVIGQTLSGMLNCQGQKGKSIPSGFTTPCTFKVSSIK